MKTFFMKALLAASVCLECSWVPQHSYHGVLLQYHFGIPFYTLLYTISYILNYFGRTFIKVVSKEKEHSRKKFRNLKMPFLFNTWKNMSGWVENSSLKIVFRQNSKSFTQTPRFLTFTMSFWFLILDIWSFWGKKNEKFIGNA